MSSTLNRVEIDAYLLEAESFIESRWKDAGKKVIEECSSVEKFDGNVRDFLEFCTACGGNWSAMFMSGISKLYPSVYDAIPEDFGNDGFFAIVYTLILLGVRTWEK